MTYVIPQVRTNYGTFNIRFQDAKVWNDISDNTKLLPLKILRKTLSYFFLKNTNNSSSLPLFFTLIFLAFLTLFALCVRACVLRVSV